MKYRIQHTTKYRYQLPVSLGYNRAHLMPRDTKQQKCSVSKIHIEPLPATAAQREDYFGNKVYYFSIENPHSLLSINVITEVDIEDRNTTNELDLDLGISFAEAKELINTSHHDEILNAREYLLESPLIPHSDELLAFAEPLFQDNCPLLSAVRALTSKIFEEFTYNPSVTNISTPLSEVLSHRNGVCQDFAHLAIGCLRALGIPARYVSGYLETLPPPGQEKLIGADASHAWFAVFSPTEGWFDFDPTNNNQPAGQHITTAWGRDYSDVTPVQGVIFDGGGGQELDVSVDVQRLKS